MKKLFLLLLVLLLVVGCKRTVILSDSLLGETNYGEMWGREIVNTTIINAGEYVNITGLSCGHTQGVSCANSKLTINKQGVYSIGAQFSFSDGANTEFHLALGKNGARDEHCHAERKIGTGGDVGSASFTCIDSLNVSDTLTIMAENTDNTNSPEIHSININVVEIA